MFPGTSALSNHGRQERRFDWSELLTRDLGVLADQAEVKWALRGNQGASIPLHSRFQSSEESDHRVWATGRARPSFSRCVSVLHERTKCPAPCDWPAALHELLEVPCLLLCRSGNGCFDSTWKNAPSRKNPKILQLYPDSRHVALTDRRRKAYKILEI